MGKNRTHREPEDQLLIEEKGGAIYDDTPVSLHEISDHGFQQMQAGSANEQFSGHRRRGMYDE